MNKKYFFGPNSPAGRQGQEKVGEKWKIGKKWKRILETKKLQLYGYYVTSRKFILIEDMSF